MKSDSVIGCVSCGKPALLVGDETPRQFPACFWCLTERRPGAANLFLDEVRTAERERVLKLIDAAIETHATYCYGAPRMQVDELRDVISRIRKGEI